MTNNLQPGQIEELLATFGYESNSITMTREVAEKFARGSVGTAYGKGYRIVSTRLENDVPDGSKGRVIAVCERVEQQNVPYRPPNMEYK